MSTIIVKYKASLDHQLISRFKPQIRQALINATVQALSVPAKAVIVDFETYADPPPEEAPDILFKAETSVARKALLGTWADTLLEAFSKLNLSSPNLKRLAAKPYALESVWKEITY